MNWRFTTEARLEVGGRYGEIKDRLGQPHSHYEVDGAALRDSRRDFNAEPPTTCEYDRRVLLNVIVALLDERPPRPSLDVRRVAQAVANVARRHGIVQDPPAPLVVARIFGYSAAPADMDAELAREYDALAPAEASKPEAPAPCLRGSNPSQGIDGHWCVAHGAYWLLREQTCAAAVEARDADRRAERA